MPSEIEKITPAKTHETNEKKIKYKSGIEISFSFRFIFAYFVYFAGRKFFENDFCFTNNEDEKKFS